MPSTSTVSTTASTSATTSVTPTSITTTSVTPTTGTTLSTSPTLTTASTSATTSVTPTSVTTTSVTPSTSTTPSTSSVSTTASTSATTSVTPTNVTTSATLPTTVTASTTSAFSPTTVTPSIPTSLSTTRSTSPTPTSLPTTVLSSTTSTTLPTTVPSSTTLITSPTTVPSSTAPTTTLSSTFSTSLTSSSIPPSSTTTPSVCNDEGMYMDAANVTKIYSRQINITDSNGNDLTRNKSLISGLRPSESETFKIETVAPVFISVNVFLREFTSVHLVTANKAGADFKYRVKWVYGNGTEGAFTNKYNASTVIPVAEYNITALTIEISEYDIPLTLQELFVYGCFGGAPTTTPTPATTTTTVISTQTPYISFPGTTTSTTISSSTPTTTKPPSSTVSIPTTTSVTMPTSSTTVVTSPSSASTKSSSVTPTSTVTTPSTSAATTLCLFEGMNKNSVEQTYIEDEQIEFISSSGADLTSNRDNTWKLRPDEENDFFLLNEPAPVQLSVKLNASVLTGLKLLTKTQRQDVKYNIRLTYGNGTSEMFEDVYYDSAVAPIEREDVVNVKLNMTEYQPPVEMKVSLKGCFIPPPPPPPTVTTITPKTTSVTPATTTTPPSTTTVSTTVTTSVTPTSITTTSVTPTTGTTPSISTPSTTATSATTSVTPTSVTTTSVTPTTRTTPSTSTSSTTATSATTSVTPTSVTTASVSPTTGTTPLTSTASTTASTSATTSVTPTSLITSGTPTTGITPSTTSVTSSTTMVSVPSTTTVSTPTTSLPITSTASTASTPTVTSPTVTTLFTSTTPSSTTLTVTMLPTSSSSMPPTTTTVSSTTRGYCVFNSTEVADLSGTNPNGHLAVGYIEKDGIPGFSAEEEAVYYGDNLEVGVKVVFKCDECECLPNNTIICVPEVPCECTYTEWSEWTCTASCGYGQYKRTREFWSGNILLCNDMEETNGTCYAGACLSTTTEVCGPWSEWSQCDCYGSLTQVRHRNNCEDSVEEQPCEEYCSTTPTTCPMGQTPVPCVNPCDDSCLDFRYPGVCDGSESVCTYGCQCPIGMRYFDGHCINETDCPCYDEDGTPVRKGHTFPSQGDCMTCICNENNQKECTPDPNCCNWGTWSPWSDCSKTCSGGQRTRERNSNGDCESSDGIETEPCNEERCIECVINGKEYEEGEVVNNCTCEICYCGPENTTICLPKDDANADGRVSQWSEWTACTKDCMGGRRTRTRFCNSPLPRCNGTMCQDDLMEEEDCNVDVSCCVVYDWTPWSPCTTSCGEGTKSRTRLYEKTVDVGVCDKPLQEIIDCPDNLPCGTTCNVTDWSDWTDCDANCGEGIISRTRINYDRLVPACSDIEEYEENVCTRPDCTCAYPMVWRNDSLCHKQTCDDMYVESSCGEERFPDCVCPEGMYNKNGECVELDRCYECEVNGVTRKNGEMWTPDGTCDLCQCVNGKYTCTPNEMVPDCSDDEEVSYEDGPCCPKCVEKKPTCQLHIKTTTLNFTDKCVTDEITIQYCAGSCGESTSVPEISMDSNNLLTDNSCKCCTGVVGGKKEVTLNCENDGTKEKLTAYIPVLSGCMCNTCQ